MSWLLSTATSGPSAWSFGGFDIGLPLKMPEATSMVAGSSSRWGPTDAHPSPANPLAIGLRLPLSNKLAPENQMPGYMSCPLTRCAATNGLHWDCRAQQEQKHQKSPGQDDPTRSLGRLHSIMFLFLGLCTHGAKYPELQLPMDGRIMGATFSGLLSPRTGAHILSRGNC